MTENLLARVAGLELLVEHLILERVMLTESPADALRQAMGGMTQLASERPDTPHEAVGAIADVLARVMERVIARER